MQRSLKPEIMDAPDHPAHIRIQFYRDLERINQLLGNWRTITRMLREDAQLRRVLDIGCGHGALLDHLRKTLHVDVVGVDLELPADPIYDVPIVQADATRDRMPEADAAVSVLTLHHMTEDGVIELFRNTARSCRRLIVLDLVRHALPFALFSVFIGPLVHHIAAVDGRQSIRRAFTADEMKGLLDRALGGTGATWQHHVSPYRANQIIDIRYR